VNGWLQKDKSFSAAGNS